MSHEADPLDLTALAKGPSGAGGDEAAGRDARRVDLFQLGFWACLLLSIAAASISLAMPNASGPSGSILLITMASGGLVFLLWTLRGAGRFIGLFPERGAAARLADAAAPRYTWIEALVEEAVLVTDPGGAPVAANKAYGELTELALITGQTDAGPVTVDRLFGASPGLAAPVYRLARAAKAGETRREVLPPIAFGTDQVPAQFEINVSQLSKGRVLWRIRRLVGQLEATGAADLKSLYVEDAPMGFFAARPDGTITYANAWLRDLLGLPETAKNIRTDDIMRPEFVKMLGRDRKSGAPGRADIQLRARDGVEIPVQAITSWSGKGVDASGRTIILANPQVLNGGEERFSFQRASRPLRPDGDPMFDDAPFGAVRLDGDSVDGAVILDANRALMEITSGRATPGTRFGDLFTSEEGEAAVNGLLVEAIDKPVALTTAGDAAKHVSVFVTLGSNGRPSVAYVIDITEQRILEKSLAQGEKMRSIGELAGKVAHDFNNVLQGVLFNYTALIERHPVGDPSYENINSIYELTARASDLVRMLMAYARVQTFRREVFNFGDFMSDYSILLRQMVDERVEVNIQHGRDVPWVKADRNQLETAILNLATNARDAMITHRGGGTLTIRTSRATAQHAHERGFNYVEEGEYLLLEVEDSGHGIPREIKDQIFQPFFTTKDKGHGTGLGLATVFGIIKQSGGFIDLTSTIGKGTTFYIYLPALKAEEIPEPAELTKLAPVPTRRMDMSGRGRILLVEDEDSVRFIAVTHLRGRGYEVDDAADGEEALEILRDKPGQFDLVISDVVMPGMDGPAMIREAKDYLGHARVIFISGYAERDIARQLDENRSVSFLPKPFTTRQLAERIKLELGSLRADAEPEEAEAPAA